MKYYTRDDFKRMMKIAFLYQRKSLESGIKFELIAKPSGVYLKEENGFSVIFDIENKNMFISFYGNDGNMELEFSEFQACLKALSIMGKVKDGIL